ncbi:testis-expressed protein 22 isoform X1 [Phoca vitulina]|uniref:testis-expressed protein 22 isoform X1 n=1 Tax=Phoca vitulina TaxID=9720 RepID=UPI001395F160|nr:testis-expressed protein 22 isoform X1 [Phoca vitulina]
MPAGLEPRWEAGPRGRGGAGCSSWKVSLAGPDAASICLGGPGSGGGLFQSPGGADTQPVGLEMDRPKHLSNAPVGKKPRLPLPQEHRQLSPALSPTVAWDQPGAQGERRQLQTQDWVRTSLRTTALPQLLGSQAAQPGAHCFQLSQLSPPRIVIPHSGACPHCAHSPWGHQPRPELVHLWGRSPTPKTQLCPPQSPRHVDNGPWLLRGPTGHTWGSPEASSVPGGLPPKAAHPECPCQPPSAGPQSLGPRSPYFRFTPLFGWSASSNSFLGRAWEMFEFSTVKLFKCLYSASTLAWCFRGWKFSVENHVLSGLVRYYSVASKPCCCCVMP